MSDKVLSGAELIALERRRQVEEEGFTAAHDDDYLAGDLTYAGLCYAAYAIQSSNNRANFKNLLPSSWPWNFKWWKPGPDDSDNSRRLELIKAGALIAAEIDRLQRKMARDAATADT